MSKTVGEGNLVRNKFILFVVRNYTVWKTDNESKLVLRALNNIELALGTRGKVLIVKILCYQ